MKKYSLIFAVLFVLIFSCAAIAADGEWTAWEAALSDAPAIECELVAPAIETKRTKTFSAKSPKTTGRSDPKTRR